MRGFAYGRCVEGVRSRARRAAASFGHRASVARAGDRLSGANAIRIHNAREHNLKNIDVAIPRDRFTVVTGVSGSGKSTLAFDILFAEGQRRYLESLNAYARQFVQPASRPDVDAIFGIPPTVAIEQRASRGGRKSTVATLTEIYHFLRLLYVKLGTQHCPYDDTPIAPQSEESIAMRLMRDYAGQRVALLAPLVVARKGYYTDLAKWAARKGFAELRVDGEMLPTQRWPRLDRFKEHSIELPVAQGVVAAENEPALRTALARALEYGKGVVHVLAQPKGRRRRRSRPGARARRATAAIPISTRACSRSTRSTAGARPASAPGRSCAASTPSRPATRSGGTNGTKTPTRPVPTATARASIAKRSPCAFAAARSPS